MRPATPSRTTPDKMVDMLVAMRADAGKKVSMNDPKPFTEGHAAAADNQPKTSNPYAPETEERQEWDKGWDRVDDSDEEGNLLA